MVAHVIRVGSVTSTNDIIRSLWKKDSASEPLTPYTAVLADNQTAGRGRLGRRWTAPPKQALLISVATPVSSAGLSWTSLLAGLAVQRTVTDQRSAGSTHSVRLKWPNDILINGRKVAGILSEYLGMKDGQHFVSIGIGLNLTQTVNDLPTSNATSLALAGGFETNRLALTDSLLSQLITVFTRAETSAGLSELQDTYRSLCVTPGTNVTVSIGDTQLTGAAIAVSTGGHLVIKDPTGAIHQVQAGHVVEHHGIYSPANNDPNKEFVA